VANLLHSLLLVEEVALLEHTMAVALEELEVLVVTAVARAQEDTLVMVEMVEHLIQAVAGEVEALLAAEVVAGVVL
jgi:hypothetical protein